MSLSSSRLRRPRNVAATAVAGAAALTLAMAGTAAAEPVQCGKECSTEQADPKLCEGVEALGLEGSDETTGEQCDPKGDYCTTAKETDPKDGDAAKGEIETTKDPTKDDPTKEPVCEPEPEPQTPTPPPPPVLVEPTVVLPATPGIAKVANKALKPRLALSKRGPRRTLSGRAVTWRIRVVNRGPGVARRVVLRDIVPAGFALTRSRIRVADGAKVKLARKRYRFANGAVVWRIGNLRPGARRTILVTMRSTPGTVGRRVNRAVLRSANHRSLVARSPIVVRRAPVTKTLPAVTG
jgi:uncharacterized repeat protein (TIGR01451 family)